MNTERRNFLKFGGASFGVLGVLRPLAAMPSKKDFEVSISGYSHAVLPRGHGQLVKLGKVIRRRYPSRDQCMQMAAFVSREKALLVFSTDSVGATSDWEISPGKTLRVRFYGPRPDMQVIEVEPRLDAIAAPYRSWAKDQYWAAGRRSRAPKISVFSVGSNPNLPNQVVDSWKFLREFEPPRGLWLTQWRNFKFDKGYPDYAPNNTTAFRELLAHSRIHDVKVFPYINGLLFDMGSPASAGAGDYALMKALRKSIPYSTQKHELRYACPGSRHWQDLILNARRSLVDSSGLLSEGVYYDMMMASAPVICSAPNHDHEPGDAYSWQRGIRRILEETDGLIMSEGCAEIYLDLVDYCLMHQYTHKGDLVPLWAHVYGDISNSIGWNVSRSASISEMQAEISRASDYCVDSLGSPWMSSSIEKQLEYLYLKDIQNLQRRKACPTSKGSLDLSPLNY